MAISGRLLADVRRFPSGCTGLLEVDRIEARGVEGRTELQLPDCTAPLLQGWRVQAMGVLRRPLPAAHPLFRDRRTSVPPRPLESATGREHRSAAASMDAVG
ncbi:hypothetical protein [Synechococcus sp. WH 8109]|uniref:hypothetical protein n=1 Tax=Synechococcus sp. WH 8109 TaxID=166314 RepID=UPI0001B8D2B7|nr:hypothetical protein [Synechococcus sp. WH 8109]